MTIHIMSDVRAFVIVAVVTLLTSSQAIIEAIYRKKKLHCSLSYSHFCNKNQQAKFCCSYQRVNVKNNNGNHALLKGVFI